ncbi:hemin uptake protein HemP [Hyphomicrobium facile]|uniref:Hemin uptake protein HemP n=1 Tax=Hyphomicrobium facile TaxID=51670 RepID=A0A1I7NSA5_9HYPH|nr:hemin uptake protein HemP [Hyphomicrobium facile]SFV37478.1 Hemin uptake protein HemP [Hyphomicrobium facile]
MPAPSHLSLIERMPQKKEVAASVLRQAGQSPNSTTEVPNTDGPTENGVRYRIDELLKGHREATLVHRGQEYRLRITATGKLILTK